MRVRAISRAPNGCSASRRQAIVRHTLKAAKGFSGNGRAHRQEYQSSRKAKLGLAILDKISLGLSRAPAEGEKSFLRPVDST